MKIDRDHNVPKEEIEVFQAWDQSVPEIAETSQTMAELTRDRDSMGPR